jgi:hypothetical protein
MSFATKLWSHTTVGVVGAAAAYFLDPDRGRARRAQTRDQLLSQGRSITNDVEKQARYFEGKLEGARARADGRGELDPQDDHLVKQGIEQRLASSGIDTADIVVDVTDGVVGLRGQASSPAELKKIELETSDVPGVEEVHSWLHLPGEVAPNKALAMRAGPSGTSTTSRD